MAQKGIEGDVNKALIRHVNLRWQKIEPFSFSFFRLQISITCQNPEKVHFFTPKTLRWPKIRTIQFLLNFGSKYQSRVKIKGHLRIFGLKKVGHLRILTRD